MERGRIHGLPNFFDTPIISGTGKATDFKFCRNIHRVDRNKSPWKMLGIVAVGVVRESRNYKGPFRETMYRVHCAVIFAIAQLSCETKHVCDGRTHIRTDEIAVTHSPIRATALYAVARKTRKLRYRNIRVLWKFSWLPDYAHGYYSQHFSWALVPIDPMNVPTKFEVRSFTRSWDKMG